MIGHMTLVTRLRFNADQSTLTFIYILSTMMYTKVQNYFHRQYVSANRRHLIGQT